MSPGLSWGQEQGLLLEGVLGNRARLHKVLTGKAAIVRWSPQGPFRGDTVYKWGE